MKLSVEFPSVSYREGPAQVAALARAIEAIGYDDLAIFDHVVMGYATETRQAPMYPSQMPILEALVTLGFIAAVTESISLSTEVLVLPQRQATLVAKQASTIDMLSGGRLRLGVGVGWQEVEYEALGEDFARRGKLMDEAIPLLRSYWADERTVMTGERFTVDTIAMEPKPPQGGALPVWIGGNGPAALRRAGQFGDGWMGSVLGDDAETLAAFDTIRRHAEAAGRDPGTIQFQAMLAAPPRDDSGKGFYQDLDAVIRAAEHVNGLGFGWLAVNATAIFQAGSRSVDALIETLTTLHGRLRDAVG